MAKCTRCSRSGLTLSLDILGHCPDCQSIINLTTSNRMSSMEAELESLRKFHDEYRIIPDARLESERILFEAQTASNQLRSDAQAAADEAINTAMLRAEKLTVEAEADCARMRSEVDSYRIATELDIQKKLASAQDKLRKLEMDTKLVVSDTETRLASLFAIASGDFMHISKYTAANAYASERKSGSKSKLAAESKVSFSALTPAAFKKSASNGYVVFDLETTGLNRSSDRIVEIGAIKYDAQHKELDRFSMLVNPSIHIPESASAINNIYDDMVANAPVIREVLPLFLEFVGAFPLVAHNAEFDIAFLRNAIETNDFVCCLSYGDSLAMCKKAYDLPNYKLASIARSLGYVACQTHRSIGDCEMLAYVIRHLLSQ